MIRLTQFYGIEIKSFPAEIARLALLIAEFQCNVRMIGQQEAILDILPLHQTGNIHCGNALRMDWLEVCPPAKASMVEEDLAGPMERLALDEPETEGAWETYICGNPPYLGSRSQTEEHKSDLNLVLSSQIDSWKSLDYVSAWFVKASAYLNDVCGAYAFVATNSLCQGLQVPLLWKVLLEEDKRIFFAHRSFRWQNLASHNAGVTVVVVGVESAARSSERRIFEDDQVSACQNINAYLLNAPDIYVQGLNSKSLSTLPPMLFGNMPRDGGHLSLEVNEKLALLEQAPHAAAVVRKYLGSDELINGKQRYCLWISDQDLQKVQEITFVQERLANVAGMRSDSSAASTRSYALAPHRFVQVPGFGKHHTIAIAGVSSEKRPYLPVDLLDGDTIVSNLLFALYDAPLWNMALIASRLHLVWIATVCGKLKTDFRYSNTLGWNTFPVPKLTEANNADLTRCAEDILLAREAHFPATIADLYDPKNMPENLRAAHERNDAVLEEIYIGRRFRNDTERLEKLFDMYTKMTKKGAA